MNIKIKKKTIVPLFLIIYIFFSQFFLATSLIARYSDELVGVFFFLYVILNIKRYKGNTLKKYIFLAAFIILIGIVSNIISGVTNNIFYIFIDILCVFKIFLTFIGFLLLINEQIAVDLSRMLYKIAEFFINICFVLGVISLFFDVGMSGMGHWGLKSFKFIYGYSHIYVMSLLFLLLITQTSHMNKCLCTLKIQ